uniref:Potassium voltage-gated channel subfamily H member 8-like n=1 Tax=Phallusia mammillata TaxID=59560 RepID=A0A6F9DF15_9ASCI|nr:potassium voltage-gated channel subfamily H member 8-like [Phallusia mammillata]
MARRKGLLAPQNTFLDTIATRFNGTHSNFLLGSAQVPGIFPIVYCSDGFCELTGFPRSQIMQQCCSCEFLYGVNTCDEDKRHIKEALFQKEEFKTEITMYKKNGESFLCLLDIVPIKNGTNDVVMFLVSHKDVTNCQDDLSDSAEEVSSNASRSGSPSSLDSPQMPSFDKLNQRRRSRAVLYNLSENLEKKRKKGLFHAITKRMFGRRKSTVPEYKVATTLQSPLTILHFGTAKTIWDWFVVLVTVYVTSVVPYYAAIHSIPSNHTQPDNPLLRHSTSPKHLPIDILVEMVFIIDIVLTFRTTYVNKSGWVVSDFRRIAINYLRTWFVIDLIAALPVDTISGIFKVEFFAHPVPLLKTVRLLRLFRLLHKIDRWSQYSALVLAMLMLMFGLVAHWLACIWFTIGWQEFNEQPMGIKNGVGWLFELSETLQKPFYFNGTGGPDVTNSYITSLYFTLSSLTSVGFGNVSANTDSEKIFSICVMMIGALMHAVVFGNVTAIIQLMYARRQQYDIKMRDLKDFIKVNRLSKPIKRRMIDYFQQTWEESGGVNPNEIMKDFPREIRADVAMHLHKELLSMPMFQRGNTGFRRYLALHTRRCKVTPGEHVIYEGDPLSTVNVVCNGSLEVLQDQLVIGILGKGDIFGSDVDAQYPLLMTSRADVKALTYCELECISVEAIFNVIYLYPYFSESFINDIKSDYSCNLWEKGPHARKNSSSSNKDTPADFIPSSPKFNQEGDEVFERVPQCNGTSEIHKISRENLDERFPLIDLELPKSPSMCHITTENECSPAKNSVPSWTTETNTSIETSPTPRGDDVTDNDVEARVVTSGLEPATYYFSERETVGKRRRGLKDLLRSISTSFSEKSAPKDEKSPEILPKVTPPLPPCIRKKPLDDRPPASNTLIRSASDNLTTKKVKFMDQDFHAHSGRKSYSVTEEQLKGVPQKLKNLHRETVEATDPSPPPNIDSDVNTAEIFTFDFTPPNDEPSKNNNLVNKKSETTPSPKKLSAATLKSTSRRRRRQRRKSLSPNATLQINRGRFVAVEDGELHSDTTPQSLRERRQLGRISDSSFSDEDCVADHAHWSGTNRHNVKHENFPHCKHVLDSMQDLLVQVSALNADVRKLFALLNNPNSTSPHTRGFGHLGSAPTRPRRDASIPEDLDQFSRSFHPCPVTKYSRKINTPEVITNSDRPSRHGTAPLCVVTSPSGEAIEPEVDKMGATSGFRQAEVTDSRNSPMLSPLSPNCISSPLFMRNSPGLRLHSPIIESSHRLRQGFVPIDVGKGHVWNSCTDLEEDWGSKQLVVPFSGGGHGSESGYISNSPTLQLRDI